MYNIDSLTLISGVDIPIPEIGLSVHQPLVKEIALIGEMPFYEAAQTFIIKTADVVDRLKNLTPEDKDALSTLSNFEVFLKLMETNDMLRVKIEMFMALLFPEYSATIEERFIMLISPKGTVMVDEGNFDMLQDVISTILCLNAKGDKDGFNPVSDKAKEIAEKLRKGRERVASLKGEGSKESGGILSKYLSGLGVGTNSLNIKDTLELTLYQLFDQLERYSLYVANDIAIRAKMAGAEGVEDVDWLKNIH